MSEVSPVKIYTDGACAGNPGPGGWGAILQYGDNYKEILGYELETTNNRMELTAAIEALKLLKRTCDTEIYTDSKYLQMGVTEWIYKWFKNNWRTSSKSLVKNVDLWQKLYSEITKHHITWHWVKGHSDNFYNNIADKLANRGKTIAIEMLKCKN